MNFSVIFLNSYLHIFLILVLTFILITVSPFSFNLSASPGGQLGLNYTPPYLAPTTSGPVILQGVNYASGAGGILNHTGKIFVSFFSKLEGNYFKFQFV